jgi:hypothetical protein
MGEETDKRNALTKLSSLVEIARQTQTQLINFQKQVEVRLARMSREYSECRQHCDAAMGIVHERVNRTTEKVDVLHGSHEERSHIESTHPHKEIVVGTDRLVKGTYALAAASAFMILWEVAKTILKTVQP